MTILVTGAAGFIGFSICKKLLEANHKVIGLDNLNEYYDVNLKKARLAELQPDQNFSFHLLDLENTQAIHSLFATEKFTKVVHMAAQAGVRYSLENPMAYINSNIVGFMNLLEACRAHPPEHLVYASSSSVYGANETLPFSVHHNVDHPLSLYAASKKSNELMAHTYSHLYGLPTTGLRFFTVYGPWGRPDMALFKFTKAMLAGEPIDVYNHGNHRRDFTYIDDIVEGVFRVMNTVPEPNLDWSGKNPDPASSKAPWRVYNIGNSSPVPLMDFIAALEVCLGKKAKINPLPLQPGDVPETASDIQALVEAVNYKPSTKVEVGIKRFVDWYLSFYD